MAIVKQSPAFPENKENKGFLNLPVWKHSAVLDKEQKKNISVLLSVLEKLNLGRERKSMLDFFLLGL